MMRCGSLLVFVTVFHDAFSLRFANESINLGDTINSGFVDEQGLSAEEAAVLEQIMPTELLDAAPHTRLQLLASFRSMASNPMCTQCNGGQAFPRHNMLHTLNLVRQLSQVASYGNTCGLTGQFEKSCGPDLLKHKTVSMAGVDKTVCDDSGTDTCCARHDTARTWRHVGLLNTHVFALMECKTNHVLLNCLSNKHDENSEFCDVRGQCENDMRLVTCPHCIFTSAPCLQKADTQKQLWNVRWPYGSYEKLSSIAEDGCMDDICYGATQRKPKISELLFHEDKDDAQPFLYPAWSTKEISDVVSSDV